MFMNIKQGGKNCENILNAGEVLIVKCIYTSRPHGKESTEVQKSQIKGNSLNLYIYIYIYINMDQVWNGAHPAS